MADEQGTMVPATPVQTAEQPAAPTKVVTEEEGCLQSWERTGGLATCGFDATTEEGLYLESRALSKGDLDARAAVGEVLELINYYAHPVMLTDMKTGEISAKIRCVFFLADGRTWATVSVPCARRLAWLRSRKPQTPWQPPIRVRVRQFPMADNRSFVDFELVPATVEPSPANGQKPRKGAT